jgi:1,4-dihydroxy-2-naphthoate octaprenyltransferase
LLLVVSYTVWWTYDPIRCLIAPGLGFGILMVMGSHFALSGHYSLIAFAASLVPTFLVSNLLLLNQFPDVEADQSIGRRHFPITIGRQASSRLYGQLLILAYATIIISTLAGLFPWTSLLALLTAIPAWQAYRLAARHAESIPELLPAMGLNVIVTVGTPFLLALGFFLAAALGLH